ncbi:hypothetical protein [Nitrospirillum iridis]|uniref:Uncharacterized protein n=1 Tax=Nitrospirillum iridis TaxID=765888 RepID=A0A7X0AXL4_9PROT|nr:hypothetical protein [Nitrospirillum iridis]MBB6250464.1 hypothetical protein [Nitrospirillum iridis]
MDGWQRRYRLSNGPGGLGVSCTAEGLALAGVPLLAKAPGGFQARPAAEVALLLKRTGIEPRAAVPPGLAKIADALNRGDMVQAMIRAVHLRLPELDWDAAVRLAQANDNLAKYSPDQPRDWHGRWTDGNGEGAAPQLEGHERHGPPANGPATPRWEASPNASRYPRAIAGAFKEQSPILVQEILPFGDFLAFGRLPPWIEALPDAVKNEFKEPIPRLSGKEGAKDPPSWAEGFRPKIGENAESFARRLMNDRYGPGNWKDGPTSPYSQIKKWADRSFRIPRWVYERYGAI